MSMANFSDRFKRVDINRYPALVNAVEVLSKLAYDGRYDVVELPDGRIGFLCQFNVDVGTSSVLRRLEPMIIAVDADNLEGNCPIAYPDRLDFPFEQLPHVCYPHGDMPPSLCLSRESDKEWYSEITFDTFVLTLKEWLSDAANDRLIKVRNNDEYEPFRVPETDATLFWYEEMDYIVENAEDYGCFIHDVIYYNKMNIGKVVFGSHNGDQGGVVVHLSRPKEYVEQKWFVKQPRDVKALFEITKEYGFEIDFDALKQMLNVSSTIKIIYLAFSVLRPTTIIGKLNKVDTICFKFSANVIRNMDLTLPVEPVALYDQTTPFFAARLSETNYKLYCKKILILGAGAVGSKLIDHLYRSGVCNLTIVDMDSFMPHNVIRHTLSKGFCFSEKSVLIKEHLEGMFMLSSSVNAVTEDAVNYLQREDLSQYDIIVDATASSRVMYALDETTFNGVIIRTCLSNEGKVGMTYVKRDANARLQEYYMQILRLAVQDEDVSKWIVSDAKTTLDRVRIGEGCHSNTMKVADDLISVHTAISSRIIKDLYPDGNRGNEFFLSFEGLEYPGSLCTDRFDLPMFVSLPTDTLGWMVRIPTDLLNQIRIQTKVGGNNETGGYLVGLVSDKRRIVYVLAQYVPKDSSKKPTSLRLGTFGVMDFLDKWFRNTGGQVRYLGDWHSHPKGSVNRSEQDIKTFQNLKLELDGRGVCIITNGHDYKAFII